MNKEAFGNRNSNIIQGHTDNQMQDSFNLLPLLLIFLRHRWTILLTTIAFLIVGFIYIMRTTPIFSSVSRLYVEQSGPKIINEFEGIMTQSSNYLQTQAELIKSTPIVSGVANDATIKHLKTFENVDNLVGYLKGKLQVSVGRNDDIITVSCESPYPEEAALLVNAAVDSYVSYHSARKRSTVSEVLKIIQKEKAKRDQDLSDKFSELLAFTKENGVVSFDNNGGNIIFQRLAKISSALNDAQLVALNAKADFEAAKSMVNEPEKIRQFAGASAGLNVNVFGSERENQLRAELRKAEMDLENARYYCTEDHPSNQAIQTKIGRIKQELNEQNRQFADAYIEVMRLRWLVAKQREEELETSFESEHQAARELGVKAAEYAVLQSELKRAERVCEILDDRIKELNVTEDTGALNISILEVARPAEFPSKPEKARIMTIALAFGLIFGTCLAFLRDWMDYRLHSSEEVSALLGIPVLGEVPAMSEEQRVVTNRGQELLFKIKSILTDKFRTAQINKLTTPIRSKKMLNKQNLMAQAKTYRAKRASDVTKIHSAASVTSKSQKDDINSEVQAIFKRGQLVRLQPRSIIAEAYRTIRTSVFFGVPKDKAKTILITSPAPSDGKTTLVSNLAIAMAQAGQRILILDADLRKPKQHKIFNVNNEPGITSVLAGTTRLDEAVQPGPVKGLDILPCGPQVPNPSEILNSETFARVLESLVKCYDRILIDSPPVVPVADSQVIAARCDIVLLVVRAEKSTRRLILRARDNIVSVGGRLLGTIVNDVAHKNGRYGGYGRYHSGYGYGGYGDYYGEDINSENHPEYEQKVCV
ncbi:MAG: polysaccharide biosynthesis tyrosine autokinase [Sedimentisphaerales bacterium]|nr:polysaccharide biosynthesis tyrosine autokinase [Sedimentisphaerales bacterium]